MDKAGIITVGLQYKDAIEELLENDEEVPYNPILEKFLAETEKVLEESKTL